MKLTALMVALALLVGVSMASQPSENSRSWLETQFAIEAPRGGSVKGTGIAHKIAVTATPGAKATGDVSSDGVMTIHFANMGPDDVYVTLRAAVPSASTADVIVPAGMAYASVTKSMVTEIRYATLSGTATLYVSY